MKRFTLLLLLLAGCGSADSEGPTHSPSQRLAEPEPAEGWENQPPGWKGKQPPGWSVVVRQAAFSPDNRYLLVAYQNDGSPEVPLGDMIPVYDLSNGQKVHTFSRKDLFDFRQIPGTSHILAVNRKGDMNVWDMTNGKRIRKVEKVPKWRVLLDISRDGNRILVGPDEVLGARVEEGYTVEEVWDIKQAKSLGRWKSEGRIWPAMFSPDGKWLFMRRRQEGKPGGKYEVQDIATRKELPLFAKAEDWPLWQYPLAFSPDGRLAVSEGWDGKKSQMVLWDWTNGKIMRKLNCQAKGRHPDCSAATKGVAFTADGKRLVSGGEQDMMLRGWDIASGKELWASDVLQNMIPPGGSLTAVAFSPDGTRALTATGVWIEHGAHNLYLRVWDCTNGTLLRELPPLPDGTER